MSSNSYTFLILPSLKFAPETLRLFQMSFLLGKNLPIFSGFQLTVSFRDGNLLNAVENLTQGLAFVSMINDYPS